MSNKNSCERQDVVVNFKDLILYILLRWRSILVCVLALTVLAGGFKYLTDYKTYKANVAAANETQTAEPNLDKIELSNVKTVVAYKNMLTAQAEYITDSPYMQLDPNKIYSANISYVLKGNETVTAASLYAQHINSSTLYETIKTKLDLPYAASYLTEVITVNVSYPDNVVIQQGNKSVINISVYATSEQRCKDITAAITDYIASFGKDFTDSGITLSQAFTDYAVVCNVDVGTQQQKAITSYNTYKKNYQDALDSLTSAELAYYNRLQQADVQVSDIAAPALSKKFLVLGFALGLILPCGIYLLAYLFGRRVKSADDFKLRYKDVTVFGNVGSNKKKLNAVDRLVIRIVCGKNSHTEFDGLLSQKIIIKAEQNGYKNIYIAGSVTDSVKNALSTLNDSGITVQYGGMPQTGAEEFNQVKNTDAVIIAAEVGNTYYNDVYNAIEFCGSVNKPVLGAVII